MARRPSFTGTCGGFHLSGGINEVDKEYLSVYLTCAAAQKP